MMMMMEEEEEEEEEEDWYQDEDDKSDHDNDNERQDDHFSPLCKYLPEPHIITFVEPAMSMKATFNYKNHDIVPFQCILESWSGIPLDYLEMAVSKWYSSNNRQSASSLTITSTGMNPPNHSLLT